ncbi:MAG: DUF6516 family protein [Pigmentiphaga sp.]|nr:DUF6516 family protein [Pigmentiphaga sp.]
MKATLIHRSRRQYRQGIIEAVVWQVPQPVPPSEHPYKYRLVYIVGGERVVGYDNERGKGDHKHLLGAELPYHFEGPDQLMLDFLTDIDGVSDE